MNATTIMEMIEYHNNDALLEAFNNPNFKPHEGLRSNGFISKAVEFNNFTIFKALINHPNLDPEKISDSAFVSRIIKRINLLENEENRSYFNELIDSKYELYPYHLIENKELKFNIFMELFNKIKKDDFDKIRKACSVYMSFDSFKIVFSYLKENFPDKMTKLYIDDNFLIKAFENEMIDIIDFIKNYGYDVKKTLSKGSLYYFLNNIHRLTYPFEKDNKSKLVKYFIEQNFTYEDDLISYIVYDDWFDTNYDKIGFIVNNFSELKKIYPNIGTTQTNILYLTISSLVSKNTSKIIDDYKILLFIFENCKSKNPLIDYKLYDRYNYYEKKINSKKELFTGFLLLLIYYNYEIKDSDKKQIHENTKIDINNFTKETAINFVDNLKRINNPTKNTKTKTKTKTNNKKTLENKDYEVEI